MRFLLPYGCYSGRCDIPQGRLDGAQSEIRNLGQNSDPRVHLGPSEGRKTAIVGRCPLDKGAGNCNVCHAGPRCYQAIVLDPRLCPSASGLKAAQYGPQKAPRWAPHGLKHSIGTLSDTEGALDPLGTAHEGCSGIVWGPFWGLLRSFPGPTGPIWAIVGWHCRIEGGVRAPEAIMDVGWQVNRPPPLRLAGSLLKWQLI